MIYQLKESEVRYNERLQIYEINKTDIYDKIWYSEFVYYIDGDQIYIYKDRYTGNAGCFKNKEDYLEYFL